MPTSPSELRGRTQRGSNKVKQAVRRMAVRIAAEALCKLIGFTDDAGNEEGDDDVDLFHGIGTFARPPAGKGAAVVLLSGGESGAPMVVATRDIETLLAVLAKRGVADDEALFYNSKTGVHAKADGVLELRTHDGVAVELATKADVQALRDYVARQFAVTGGHTHVVAGGSTTTITTVGLVPPPPPATVPPPNPVGTTKTKAE